MKTAEITSIVGCDIVASFKLEGDFLTLSAARRLRNTPVYTDKKTRTSSLLGHIKDVIGRTDKPYFVIKPSEKFNRLSSDLVGRSVYFKLNYRGKNDRERF